MKITTVAVALGSVLGAVSSFTVQNTNPSRIATSRVTTTTSSLGLAKGFAEKPAKKVVEKSEGAKRREAEAERYEEISKSGGQEYSIFVRQFGSDDKSWLPCGKIAVPRGAQVSDAIYTNEENLKVSIVRTYPKLKGYEPEMEFGFNLAVYPDDPIEVARKNGQRASGMSFGNWISTLLSPIDNSGVPPPPMPPTPN